MEPPVARYAHSGETSIAYQVFEIGEIDLLFAMGPASHLDLHWEHPLPARQLISRQVVWAGSCRTTHPAAARHEREPVVGRSRNRAARRPGGVAWMRHRTSASLLAISGAGALTGGLALITMSARSPGHARRDDGRRRRRLQRRNK